MFTRMSRQVLAPLALAAGLAPGLALADAKADFVARYAQLDAAVESREPETVQPFVTPDFSVTDIRGRTQPLEAMLDRLAMIPVDPDRKESVTIDSVEVQGETAQVLQHRERGGSREGPDGQTHTMSFATASQDTWVQSPSGWRLKASVAQTMTVTRDGQVVRQVKQGDPMPERGAGRRRGPGRDGMRPSAAGE